MNAIAGESLFYEASKVISGNGSVSYYQYKSLDSFIELITLHDNIALFVGEETDDDYLNSFDWLINIVHEKTDCKIDFIKPERRGEYITSEAMSLFETICREVYSHSLGIISDDLFYKRRKDRTAEDMSSRIEQLFIRDYPEFDCKNFGEGIYHLLQKNANSSELLYFFRAHLFQSIAELQNLTPVYENQRLIASIFQQRCRKENRTGTLPYIIYKMANNLFMEAYDSLPNDRVKYPRISILMNALIESTLTREALVDSIALLRNELKEFREAYVKAEAILVNPNKSFLDRTVIQKSLEESIREIWMPVIASLERNDTSNKIKKVAKGVFGKFGIGDVKFQHSEKKDLSENTVTYSTASITGLVTAIAQTVSEVHKASKLIRPNKPLLDIILRVARSTDTKQKLSALLPVRGFGYRLPNLIDKLLAANVGKGQ